MARDPGPVGLGRRSYEAQEVLRLLGVKAHVLRYWEQSLPLIRPRRNESGHRVWSAAQVRMLLRIRHLVLRRGMSVSGAGNAILYEAEPGPADTKARLESLRAGLITLLLRSRADIARVSVDVGTLARSTGGVDGADGEDQSSRVASDGSDARFVEINAHRSGRLEGSPIILESVLSARVRSGVAGVSTGAREGVSTGGRRAAEIVSSVGVAAGGRAGDDLREETELPSRTALVPIAHLFGSDEGPEQTRADVLTRLLVFHREAIGEVPLIIPAPASETDRYRSLLTTVRPPAAGDIFLLPISPVSVGGVRWWSPRLSLLVEIASNQDLAQWLEERVCTDVYLWSPDDRSLPVRPTVEWVRLARENRYGISPAAVVRRGASGAAEIRLPDAAVISLSPFRSALAEVIAVGRWHFALTPRDSSTERTISDDPVGRAGAWRYDIWQRDLLRLDVPVFAPGEAPCPAPWRGRDWEREVAHFRPELSRSEGDSE